MQIIRTPLFLLPLVLSNTSDAVVALGRISKFLLAEELEEPYKTDPDSKYAIDVEGDFAWETVQKPDNGPKFGAGKKGPRGPSGDKDKKSSGKTDTKAKKRPFWRKKSSAGPILPTTAAPKDANTKAPKSKEKPFELNKIRLKVPRGSFVAIVGRVGSGKVGFEAFQPLVPSLILYVLGFRAHCCKL